MGGTEKCVIVQSSAQHSRPFVLLLAPFCPSPSFGLSGELPGIVVEDRVKNKNFIFPEGTEVTTAALVPFFGDYLAGKLKATTKSQPEPANNNGPVKVIVGTTFESIALQDDKDVLVEFYGQLGAAELFTVFSLEAASLLCSRNDSSGVVRLLVSLFLSSVCSSLVRPLQVSGSQVRDAGRGVLSG
jgi:hypothetical protein